MGLRESTITGIFWSSAAQVGQQITRVGLTVILARVLVPEDFGLMAMAFVFTQFTMIFGGVGLRQAIIYRQDLGEEHYSSVFWLQLILGVLLVALMFLLAPWIAAFYQQPRLTLIVRVLSINLLAAPLASTQGAILAKRMNFKILAKQDVGAMVLSGVVAAGAAILGFGVWSLVLQAVSFSVSKVLILWILFPWKPRFLLSIRAIREIFPYGAYMTAVYLTDYLVAQVDLLLIGRFLNPAALGFYTMARKLIYIPLQNISGVLAKVAFPAFSRIQDDLARTRVNYLRMVRGISILSLPMTAAIFAAAPEIVSIFLGPGWEPVVFLARVFCFCGMLDSIGTTVRTLFVSQGRPDLNARFSLYLSLPLTTLAVVIGLPYGLEGVAICYGVRTALIVGASHIIGNRIIGLAWGDFVRAQRWGYLMAVLSGLAMLVGGHLASQWLGPQAWPVLLLKGLLGGCVFAALVLHSGISQLRRALTPDPQSVGP